MRKTSVFKIPTSAPNDLTGLQALVQGGEIVPREVVAILGKTEGNGCVNDFTRGYAVDTLQRYLSSLGCSNIVMVMSGGTEGVLSPHITVFTRQEVKDEKDTPSSSSSSSSPPLLLGTQKGLAIGTFHTRDYVPREIGTLDMVEVVAQGVQEAMKDAGIDAVEDVHFCQIKCPLLTTDSIKSRTDVKTTDPYKSMAYSRGASALGVAVALGEVNRTTLQEDDILQNWNLYSSVASTSAGVELRNCEIMVLGNSTKFRHSDYVIGHDVMHHALDQQALERAMPVVSDNSTTLEIVHVLSKAEADPSGMIMGCRHTMLEDSDINHTRMARAVVAAVLAAALQSPLVYVSGGAEHQGPSGGGPIAVIAKR